MFCGALVGMPTTRRVLIIRSLLPQHNRNGNYYSYHFEQRITTAETSR